MAALFDRFLSITLTAASVTLAATLVYRTVREPDRPGTNLVDRAATKHADWEALIEQGITIHGDSTARLTLLEFADLECPACREFHKVMNDFIADNGSRVRVVYLAFPLPSHRFAMPAARAVECASKVGRASEFIDAVYARQDSLGLKPWGEYAAAAGITDTTLISNCARTTKAFTRIDSSVAIAGNRRFIGTPTILINGWQMPTIPTRRGLDSALTVLDPRP